MANQRIIVSEEAPVQKILEVKEMLNHPSGFRSIFLFVLLTLCINGCSPYTIRFGETQKIFNVISATGKIVELEFIAPSGKSLAIHVDKTKWGSSTLKADMITHVTLEVSDQISLEDGSLGYGMINTISYSGISDKQYLGMSKDGQLPFGQVKIRDAANMSQTDGIITLADIETPDGSLVPVFLKLENSVAK